MCRCATTGETATTLGSRAERLRQVAPLTAGLRDVQHRIHDGSQVSGVEARLGRRLKASREQHGLSVRGLARDLGVSASFVSQLENGKARPSVATLYSMSSTLGISIDDLFSDDAMPVAGVPQPAPAESRRPQPGTPARRVQGQPAPPPLDHSSMIAAPVSVPNDIPRAGPVVRSEDRRRLELNSGVVWQQLAMVQGDIDFMLVTYDVGGSSTPDQRLIRHAGIEYGYVISGKLELVLGFESHILGPGDSIAFDSATQHRLSNVGDDPVEGIWFVRGRGSVHEHG